MEAIILFAVLVFFLLLSVPVGIAVGVATAVVMIGGDIPFTIIALSAHLWYRQWKKEGTAAHMQLLWQPQQEL